MYVGRGEEGEVGLGFCSIAAALFLGVPFVCFSDLYFVSRFPSFCNYQVFEIPALAV